MRKLFRDFFSKPKSDAPQQYKLSWDEILDKGEESSLKWANEAILVK